ncbi:MAG: hypothetical protein EPN23_08695 [Verrucomicrobia bacterium]|nr:MAG: hypothetical protein EPN23_08695 [Verrucomicrobiota bacterium]
MARKFNVPGTSDFLVWAVILLALGAWCVKDGWFPSEATLKKHPREVKMKTDLPGLVKDVFVKPCELVREGQPVARILLTTNGEQMIRTPIQGYIANTHVQKNDLVNRDQVVATMTPEDTFYSFNKSLAVLALLGALVCAVIHLLVR